MKRVITCSDGTWNKPNTYEDGRRIATNVEKIYNAILPFDDDIQQLKFYDTGVGTSYSKRKNIWEGITGAGIDKNIKDAYRFLVMNYEEGDQIWHFGFSRGAYTARSLAGFIYNCGVLRPEFIHLTDEAYELYRNRNDYAKPDSDMMVSFRQQYGHTVNAHFIGVWDTVGALGFPLKIANHERYRFHDAKLNEKVKHAYHALAIHERRSIFKPELWEKSNAAKKDPNLQTLKQVWFYGVHSNVGGGYPYTGLSDIALDWMAQKAIKQGLALKFEPLPDDYRNHEKYFELVDSRSGLFKILKSSWRPVCEKPDREEYIHPSVKQFIKDKPPANLKSDYEKLMEALDEASARLSS